MGGMPAQLELVPGDSLGPFKLGCTLFSIINLLRSHRDTYSSVKVAWDEHDPSTTATHLRLLDPPIHLLFEPLTQRLCRIELSSSEPGARVSYRGKPLQDDTRDEEHMDAVKTIRRVMGPTYGSGKAADVSEDMLSYPGVAFGVVKAGDGISTAISRIVLTPLPSPAEVSIEQAWLHPTLPTTPTQAHGDVRVAEIRLDASGTPALVQLQFYSAPGKTPIDPVDLVINVTTSEDLLSDLGAAVRSFWKEDDRMSIHAGPSSVDPALEPNPYFLSYPHLGLTFLLHATRHVLLKVILHSNLPGEVNFGRTTRCLWEIVPPRGERQICSTEFGAVAEVLESSSKGQEADPGTGGLLSTNENGSRAPSTDSARSTTPASNTHARKTVSARPHPPKSSSSSRQVERPMILDRTADSGESGIKGKQTEIHGFPGIAFEVTGSGHVETVWLF